MDIPKTKRPPNDHIKDYQPQLYTHVGEVLLYKYMVPNDLSIYRVANDIHILVSRLQNIVHKRHRITADVSLRLGKYFEVSPTYFMDLQAMFETDEKRLKIQEELDTIPTYIESKIDRGVYNPD